MSEPPKSPFTLTPTRIAIIAFVLLALLFGLGTVFGGLDNYKQLSDAAASAASAAPGDAGN